MLKMIAATLLATTPLALAGGAALAQEPSPVARAVANATVPIEVFSKRPFLGQPRISPDGTKVVAQMTKDKKGFLGIIDLTQPNKGPKLFVASDEYRDVGDRTVAGWRWVGNDHVVVTMASRENIFGQRADLTRLISYNVKSGKITPVAWDKALGSAAQILHIDHDKGTVLLQRQSDAYGTERWFNPEVVRADVSTGKYEVVQRPNPIVRSWIADGKGVVRAGIGYDAESGKQRLLYRSNASENFRTVSNAADKDFTGSSILPELFLDEPDMAIATSNKDGFRKVYKVNMNTMQLGPVLFEKPGYDIEGGVHSNWADNQMVGVRYTAERDRDAWMDQDLRVIQSNMDELFGAGNAQLVSRDKEDRKLIFYVAKTSQPGAYYIYDTRTGNMSNLGYLHPVLHDATLNPMKTVTYTARDGLKIPAVVTMPRHRPSGKNLPVVILPHGGPFGVRQKEEFGFFPWHQALAEQGYVVIEPNYRGSGGYGRDFVLKGRAADGYGKKMQDDLNDAVAWFAKEGTIDPKRACIMGWSYGGYAAARGAQRDPDLWRCAIAGAGVYDMAMMNAWDRNNLGTFSARFQDTSNDPDGISSAKHTDGKWSPILIVAGLRDQRIPIEQSRTLVSRLKGSGKKENVDFRYIEQPQGTHNLPYEDVSVQFLDETLKWLTRFNPAYTSSDPDKAPPKATTLAAK